jgi:hypothetical protein
MNKAPLHRLFIREMEKSGNEKWLKDPNQGNKLKLLKRLIKQ